jgi:hypothetical protein
VSKHDAFYKARRLKRRHHKRGHTPWCSCPEMITTLLLLLRRRFSEPQETWARKVVKQLPTSRGPQPDLEVRDELQAYVPRQRQGD